MIYTLTARYKRTLTTFIASISDIPCITKRVLCYAQTCKGLKLSRRQHDTFFSHDDAKSVDILFFFIVIKPSDFRVCFHIDSTKCDVREGENRTFYKGIIQLAFMLWWKDSVSLKSYNRDSFFCSRGYALLHTDPVGNRLMQSKKEKVLLIFQSCWTIVHICSALSLNVR